MEEKDEELTHLQNKLTLVLRELAFLSNRIQQQSKKLLTEIETGKLNAVSLARLGSKAVIMLKSMKGNSTSTINSLHKDLVPLISEDSNYFPIFCNMQSALDKCRSNAIIEDNGTYNFAEPVHKETMTDSPYETSNTDSGFLKSTETNDSSDLDQDLNSYQEINSLSLKKEHSEDTFQTEDEQWMDTLQRTNDNSRTAAVLSDTSPNTDVIESQNKDVSILVILSSDDELETTEDTISFKRPLKHRKNAQRLQKHKTENLRESDKIPTSSDDDEEDINQNVHKNKNNSSENLSKSASENAKKNINNLKKTLQDDENQDAYELETQGYNSGDNEDAYDLETEKFSSGEEDIDSATFSCHDEHSYSAPRSNIEINTFSKQISVREEKSLTAKEVPSEAQEDKESNEEIGVDIADPLGQEKKSQLNDISDDNNKTESKTEKILTEKEKSLHNEHQGTVDFESDSEFSHLSSEDINDPNYSSQQLSEDSDQNTICKQISEIGNLKELEIAKDINLNPVIDNCAESDNSKINDNLENTAVPETEKEILNEINQENKLDPHNNLDSPCTANDFPEDSNENQNNGEGKEVAINSNDLINQDQELESSKLAPDIVSNTVNNEDVGDNKKARYTYNDHNYSSSVDKDLDSDTTDIDRNVSPSSSGPVLVNALDNFGLETSEDEPRLSQGESVKSFEFDIGSNGDIDLTENDSQLDNDKIDEATEPDKKIEDSINHDKEIQEMERTSTPEPLTKNVPVSQDSVDNFVKELEILLDDSLNKMSDINNEELKNISEKELLDCTLEEYLSEGEEGNSNKTVIYDINAIKIENESIHIDDSNIKKENFEEFNTSKGKDIGDEILELLREVPVVSVGDLQTEIHEIEEDSDVSQKAEAILKALYEDQSEISSTEDSDGDFNLSDSSVCSVVEKEGSEEIKNKLKEHNMLELSISLERMEMSANDIRKFSKENHNDIDWLCDLTNVIKRKQTSSPASKKTQKKREKVSTHTSSDSFQSSSDDENFDHEVSSGSPILDGKLEQKLDEFLASAICRDMKSDTGEDSDDSDDESDSDSEKSRNKKKNPDNKHKSEKPILSKEELEKRAWRNDPLLTGNLSDSSSARCKSKAKKRELDTDFSVESDHLNSDSDRENEKRRKILAKFEENNISPIKRNLPDTDSSDTDSDVQFVSPIKTEANIEPGDVMSPSQKGRREIRSILSDDDLAKETINARSEEIERIGRLSYRQDLIETLSQSFSSQQSEDEIPPLILDIDEESGKPLVQVHQKINKKLKPHQRDGVKFMWDSCYESVERLKEHPGSGCILAHCMGLGKTMQVLTLCHTLFSHKTTNTKHVLVVCPLSTVSNWKKETKIIFNCLKSEEHFSVFTIDGAPKNKDAVNKYDIVKTWYQRKKAILILGYECYVNLTLEAKLEKASKNLKQRILECLVDPGPDLVICDEGHLIKNKKALKTIALYKIKTKRRIILTGTPLQNNLVEYYHMVNFVKPNLLGNIQEFKTNFVNPITNGQFEDSNEWDIRLMKTRTHVLHKILLKTVQRFEEKELERYLPRMLDYAIFIQLNQVQVDLYNTFLKSTLLNPSDSKTQSKFLSDFQMFQLICTHPQLMQYSEKKKNKKIEKDVITIEDDPFPPISVRGWWKDKIPADSSERVEYGTKLMVLKTILEECETVGDKLLVFSQSLIELDLIEHFLQTIGTEKCRSWRKKIDYFRMDGTVLPHERSVICDTFNDENRKKVRLLLMSTKVGGLGLNLTAANRVVIMTVHWNPSYDTQSVFRVYRFGQKKQVFVYRLVALDTMESKVYQRQVTKLAIARRVVDKHHIMRHYKSIDLQEMYSCTPNADNERPTPNFPEDEMLAKVILKLPYIFKYHEHTALLVDTPQDKLSEQELATAWEDFKNNKHTFKPPPPDPQNIPQNYSTGPTFNMAYNLGRTDLPPKIDYAEFSRQYHQSTIPPQKTNLSTRFAQNNTTITVVTQQSSTSPVNGTVYPKPSTSTSIRKLYPLPTASTSRQIPSSSNGPQRANNLTELERNSSSNSFANRLDSNCHQTWPYTNRQYENRRLQAPLKVNSKTGATVQNNPRPAPGSLMSNTNLKPKTGETVQNNPVIPPQPAPGNSKFKTNLVAKENSGITVVKRPKIIRIVPNNKPNNFKTNNPINSPSKPSVLVPPGNLVKNPLHSKQNKKPPANRKSPLVIHATNAVPPVNDPLHRNNSGGVRKRIRLDNGQEHEIIIKKMKDNFMNSIGKKISRQKNRPVEHINLDDDDDEPNNASEAVLNPTILIQ